MTPEEQTALINAGLNAITEQLQRVNKALELLVASLADHLIDHHEKENRNVDTQ